MSDHRAILEAERRERAAIAARRAERITHIRTDADLDAVFARVRERFTVAAVVTWPRDDLGRPVDP